jgi:hypothetical protein
LLLLNLPFIIAGIMSALVAYKLRKLSRRKFIFQTVLWLLVLLGLVLAYPIYTFLFSNNLTNTEPLSLFDVIQITGIVLLFFLVNRARSKLDTLERQVHDLHRELSIRLSGKQ